jgi:hypothetical protein
MVGMFSATMPQTKLSTISRSLKYCRKVTSTYLLLLLEKKVVPTRNNLVPIHMHYDLISIQFSLTCTREVFSKWGLQISKLSMNPFDKCDFSVSVRAREMLQWAPPLQIWSWCWGGPADIIRWRDETDMTRHLVSLWSLWQEDESHWSPHATSLQEQTTWPNQKISNRRWQRSGFCCSVKIKLNLIYLFF